jgi:glucans biosynthesis protein C
MTKPQRLYYLDWLRVGAFGLLFLFHALRFFDDYPWHIKNGDSSSVVNHFVEFVHYWRMQLIFLISGAGTFFAMRARKERFIRDRWLRLIIPFVFGMIILIPPQKYLEAVHQGGYNGDFWSYLRFYPQTLFFANIGFNLSWAGHIGYHIWYLAYLFIQTILLLPILKLLRDNSYCRKKIDQLSNNLFKLFYLFVPLIAIDFFLRPLYPTYLNWADFAVYTVYFLLGYLFQLSDSFINQVARNLPILLLIGVSCTLPSTLFRDMIAQWSAPVHQWEYLVIIALKNVNTLAWVLSFMGLAKKFMNFKHPLLNDLNQGILPFYILHQTVLVLIGFFVVQLSMGIVEKFVLIFLVSFIITIGLYQIIWRYAPLRFLFGMKKKSRSTAEIKSMPE